MEDSQDKETGVQGHQVVQVDVHQEDEQQLNIQSSLTPQIPSSNELGSGLVPNIP